MTADDVETSYISYAHFFRGGGGGWRAFVEGKGEILQSRISKIKASQA